MPIIQRIHGFQLFFIYLPLVGLCVWVLYLLVSRIKLAVKKRVDRQQSENAESGSHEEQLAWGHSNDDDFMESHRRSHLGSETYRMMRRKLLDTTMS